MGIRIGRKVVNGLQGCAGSNSAFGATGGVLPPGVETLG